jgi:hypothetical protein
VDRREAEWPSSTKDEKSQKGRFIEQARKSNSDEIGEAFERASRRLPLRGDIVRKIRNLDAILIAEAC